MNRCQAESYCRAFNPEKSNCHEHCIGYIQMQNIYTLSNIPLKYQHHMPLTVTDEDRAAYVMLKSWMDESKERIDNGEGLFIYSEGKGNGKTSWACKIVNHYFRQVAMTNNLRCRGLFVSVPEFLQDLRYNMDNPSETMRTRLKHIKMADVVIWDDIGTESPTKWVREQLYIFINQREANGKSNIFTSNIGLETLSAPEYLGERIASRILGTCDIVEFLGHDRRPEQKGRKIHG